MKKPKEKLPAGIDRLPSGALRVRLRVKGFPTASTTLPLFEDSPKARGRQLDEARAWLATKAVRLKTGQHVRNDEAMVATVGDALRQLRDGPVSEIERKGSREIATYQINALLSDPIADRPVALVSRVDMANLVARLITKGWQKSIDAAIARLGKQKDERGMPGRLREVKALPSLRREAEAASGPERARLLSKMAALCEREAIKGPAQSTIKNQMQRINKALHLIGQTIEGAAPPIRGVHMPIAATKGRNRRLRPGEEARLLTAAAAINPLAALVIRFAIATAYRRDRCLTVRTSNIIDLGGGAKAIAFARESGTKRTGIVPLTAELRSIIDSALPLGKSTGNDRLIFETTEEQFENWMEKALNDAGMTDFRFHDLRHEATSRLFERGLNMAEVMSITGHTTTEMVERYTHYSSVAILKKLEKDECGRRARQHSRAPARFPQRRRRPRNGPGANLTIAGQTRTALNPPRSSAMTAGAPGKSHGARPARPVAAPPPASDPSAPPRSRAGA